MYSYICGMIISEFEERFSQWCIERHRETNHFYGGYLPYEFHLRMVVGVCDKFQRLTRDKYRAIRSACWGHDLIEDCRVNYNDIICLTTSAFIPDIIYAVTNEKGKNRNDRASEKYYEGVRNTPGAVFVKLCDRIANVQYGVLMGSAMVDMYRKENDHFMKSLGYAPDHELKEMFDFLESLF